MDIQTERSPVTVNLIRNHSYKIPDTFKVNKADLTIHPGDQVKFIFFGCENPIIMIPVEGIFTQQIYTDKEEHGIIRMDVRTDANTLQKPFPYMVFTPDIDLFAEGNSPPRMIIEKKTSP